MTKFHGQLKSVLAKDEQQRAPELARVRKLFAGASSLLCLLGCAGGPLDSETLDDTGVAADEQPITGGTLVTGPENVDVTLPYGAVVRLNSSCTATKIGARRFITATHCLSRTASSVRLTSALNGSSNEISVGVVRILRHPSNTLGFVSDDIVDPGVYEVTLFDVDRDTSFPVLAQLTGQPVLFNTSNLTLAGYGCDEVSTTNDFLKQKGTFTVAQASSTTHDVHFLAENTPRNSCDGDSGGPLFRFASSRWTIVGIVTGSPFFTRLGNVYEWLVDPVENVFSNNSTGSFMNAKVFLGAQFKEVHCASQDLGGDVLINHCDNPEGLFSGQNHLPGWRLIANPAMGAGQFKIVNRNNGECMSVTTSGTNVTTRACAGNLSPLLTRQKESWSFVDRGQFGEPATTGGTPLRVFASVNLANQACLGTVNGSTAIGADVRVFPCNTSNTDQNWVFTR